MFEEEKEEEIQKKRKIQSKFSAMNLVNIGKPGVFMMPTQTPTPTITPSITPSPTITPSITPSPTITPSITPSPTITPSITNTPSTTPLPPFISIWTASAGLSNTVELPYTPFGNFSGTINWGDGNTSANTYANRSHTYALSGDYTVTISGVIEGWDFLNNAGSYSSSIKEILQWGPLRGEGNSNSYMFFNCQNLVLTGVTDTPNLVGIQSLANMFNYCYSITTVNNMNSWNTSSVTDMSYMFAEAINFDQNIGNWNVSNVINMTSMFGTFISQSKLKFNNGGSPSISGWDVSKVTSMESMFRNNSGFTQDIGNWNVSGVTSMFLMFYNATNFNQNLGGWDVSNVGNMINMLDNSGIDQANYNSLLVGWSGLTLQNGVTFGVNNLIYNLDPCQSGQARKNIKDNYSWNFTGDIGLICPGGPTGFTTVWQLNGYGETITLPYESAGTYSGNIYWGDGSVSANTYNNRQHSYSLPGTYTVVVSGDVTGFKFNNGGDKTKIKSVLKWDKLRGLSNSNANMFYGCSNLNLNLVDDIIDLSGINSVFSMFGGCTNLTTINGVNSWDISSVTDLGGMFNNCQNFDSNLGNWDTSNVYSLRTLFYRCFKFNNGNSTSINNWITSAVTDMSYTFQDCYLFNQPLNNWDVKNVQYIDNMFNGARVFNQPLNNWGPNLGSCSGMVNTFRDARLFNQDIGNWNVSAVTNMTGTFLLANSFNQNIGSWNVSNVTNMSSMFQNATVFNNGGSPSISGWDVSNVTNMNFTFRAASQFNQNIGSWDVSKVQFMRGIFQSATTFNQNLNLWNTSSVTSMREMFFGATQFNNSLTGFTLSAITSNLEDMLTNCAMDTTNYSDTLISWANQPSIPNSKVLGASGRTYNSTAAASRTLLINSKFWAFLGDTQV